MELHPCHDQEGTDSSQGKSAMSLTVHILSWHVCIPGHWWMDLPAWQIAIPTFDTRTVAPSRAAWLYSWGIFAFFPLSMLLIFDRYSLPSHLRCLSLPPLFHGWFCAIIICSVLCTAMLRMSICPWIFVELLPQVWYVSIITTRWCCRITTMWLQLVCKSLPIHVLFILMSFHV